MMQEVHHIKFWASRGGCKVTHFKLLKSRFYEPFRWRLNLVTSTFFYLTPSWLTFALSKKLERWGREIKRHLNYLEPYDTHSGNWVFIVLFANFCFIANHYSSYLEGKPSIKLKPTPHIMCREEQKLRWANPNTKFG